MSISTEIQRLQNAKAEIKSAIEEKGVEVGDGRIDTYAEKISQITSGDGGYDEGYEAGQKAEYDRFWDSFQKQGTRKAYRYGFAGRGWTDDTFKPKYDIVPNPYEAIYMFAQSEVIDLEQCLVNCGVKLDLSKVVNALSLFEDCTLLTRIPTIDLSAVTNFPNTFKSCTSLLEIRFEGVIGSNVSFQDSPLLTHQSLMSIINALKDFSGTTTTRTLTLHANSKALLTDSEKAIATQKGWTIA